VVKAFAAGTDMVMIGSMFAAHLESPGVTTLDPKTQKWMKSFYGLSSNTAIEKYNMGLLGYRTFEGRHLELLLKGPLFKTIRDINGSIRSACSYTNSLNLEEFYDNSQFVRVTQTHNTSLVS
jgi:GMP reductase